MIIWGVSIPLRLGVWIWGMTYEEDHREKQTSSHKDREEE